MEKIPCKKFTDHRKEIEARIAGKDYIIYFLSEMKTGKDADCSLLNPKRKFWKPIFLTKGNTSIFILMMKPCAPQSFWIREKKTG